MLTAPPSESRSKTKTLLMNLQEKICNNLEILDGEERFQEESWIRPEGGGGRSRVLKNGKIFEQAGVNFSEVYGRELPQSIISQRPEAKGHEWFATGTSLVLHPKNPFIPTVHLNYRYFEAGPVWWFGGGADLTPYYPYLTDVRHFHETHRQACKKIDNNLHKVFKPWCDEYFYLKHRKETRGAGGIFFDYLDTNNWEKDFDFIKDIGECFLKNYAIIIKNNINKTWTKDDREKLLIKRGRYAEFNLLYDRGTKFGLKTDGNIEAILMSMPPKAKWD